MSAGTDNALARLRQRAASVPARIEALGDALLELPTAGIRRVVTTGVGSSGAHARSLAHHLGGLGVPARFLSPSSFPAEHAQRHREDLLVVFSQGLSPNARLATAEPGAWQGLVVVTSTRPGPDERGQFAQALEDAGAILVDSGAGDEYGTLVRLAGPAIAYWPAWQVARAFGAAPGPSAAEVAGAAQAAFSAAQASARAEAALLASAPLLFLAGGALAPHLDNLRLKASEALLRPMPPVTDLLDFAHGPFQVVRNGPAFVVAFVAQNDPAAPDHLDRIGRMLDARHHRLVPVWTTLPEPLAAIEAEAAANAFILAAMAAAQRDPETWPGKDEDEPLYGVGRDLAPGPRTRPGIQLDAATWPEVDAHLAAGRRTALLPLGSTEQHGPHLPLATDTWIAEAVGLRVVERMPDAVLLPTLPVGAASEHLAFAGTLSVTEETLAAVLADIGESLAHHGFEHVFCYSAHGGNLGTLRNHSERLVQAAAPAHWFAFTEHGALFEEMLAADPGISAAEAGQHAGELETSILDRIRPGAVRRNALKRGFMESAPSGSALFYPDLRRHARDGVVGDPRRASRDRAERYLAAWADVLVRAFETQRAAHSTNGTVSA